MYTLECYYSLTYINLLVRSVEKTADTSDSLPSYLGLHISFLVTVDGHGHMTTGSRFICTSLPLKNVDGILP